MTKRSKKNFSRGTIQLLKLKQSIQLNGKSISEAMIEIDHINYGLNKKTRKLNKKARSNFNLNDIEDFLKLLNGEYILYREIYRGCERYEIRIDGPASSNYAGHEFLLIFNLDNKKTDRIYTVTLYRI